MANLLDNVSKHSPQWYNRMKKCIVIGLIPVFVTTIKGLWTGDESHLNKILLVITVTLPGILEAIGLFLAADDQP